MTETITALSQLGPALGSVAVIGLICYKLLQMFDKHSAALVTIQANMQSHTQAMQEMTRNVEANTKMTQQVINIIEKKIA